MPELTTLPNATTLNPLTDKALIQQGGVLKNARPELFGARLPGPDPIANDGGTVDLVGEEGNEFTITGGTNVTSIVLEENRVVYLIFASALTIIHNTSAIVGIRGGNVKLAANDKVRVVGKADDVVLIETLQPAARPTYELGNFPDPGLNTASAAVGGQIGTHIFGSVYLTPDDAMDKRWAFAVETGIGTGSYTDAVKVGMQLGTGDIDLLSLGFSFFVPTGRKWKYYAIGDGGLTMECLSAIEI
jgi:hypothetical protein